MVLPRRSDPAGLLFVASAGSVVDLAAHEPASRYRRIAHRKVAGAPTSRSPWISEYQHYPQRHEREQKTNGDKPDWGAKFGAAARGPR